MTGKTAGIVCAAAVATAAVIVYGLFDPAQTAFFPKCPFLMLTGLECPGCGSQRALHQLLHLNLKGALEYNPLVVAAIPFCAFVLSASVLRDRFPALYRVTSSRAFAWGTAAAVGVWWILRNLVR